MSFPPPAPFGAPPEPRSRPSPGRGRWRLLGFSLLIGALYATVSDATGWTASVAALRSYVRRHPDGIASADLVTSMFGPFVIAIDVACAVIAVVLVVVAVRMWRRDHRRLGWGFLLAVPAMVVAGIPLAAVDLGALVITSVVHHSDQSSTAIGQPSGVEIVNDLAVPASVTYCPKQDCVTGWTITLRPGQSHRSGRPSGFMVPDEIRVDASVPRCTLVVPDAPSGEIATVKLSTADARGC